MAFAKLTTLATALTATLLTATNAHLIMQTPIPFGVDTLNNSPLVDIAPGTSTSDYPCKLRTGVYDITAMNNMKVGSTQELSFTGSASHGGGTCQLVYTTDLEPSANTTFKIFQVYEGGCPIQADGNDGTHPWTFVLPEGTPNGRLTMAWIWYNRIGNREIYMNCAPLDVTGGSDESTYYDSLPNAYIINLPTSDCSTVEESNQIIPYPGQFILKDDSTTIASASGPSCSASAAAMTEGVSGYDSTTSSNGAASTAPATNEDVTAAATGSETAAAGSTAGSSQAAATTPATTSAAAYTVSTAAANSSQAASASSFLTVSTAATSSSAAVAVSSGYAAASGTASSSTGTCSTSDALVCNGESLFGLCNDGTVIWQSVADGTKCEDGAVVKKREVSVLRHPHVRRHVREEGVHGL